MTRVGHVVYLHGFASSPRSSKAQFFGRQLAARGVTFSCPDLNEPSFRTLTVTRMLDQAAKAVAAAPKSPVALVGSSLGAFVAAHAAARDRSGRIDRLVLLAPAFDFGGNRLRQLGEQGIDEWRRSGHLRVFHHADGQPREIDYALYEDAARYDAFALDLPLPMLIVHGRRDETCDPAMVDAWVRAHPSADLRMVDDTHQLTSSMDEMWRASEALFGLNESADARRATLALARAKALQDLQLACDSRHRALLERTLEHLDAELRVLNAQGPKSSS
jgi:pimeloyl-ACP methyl ester carboxylesterase